MRKTIVSFDRQDDESLMVINFTINNSTVLLAFDTGATHTVIDTTALLLMNLPIPKNAEIGLLETAKGIIEAPVIEIPECHFGGITRKKFKIHSYDYIANGVLADIDGVLGLDFFQDYKFCVDTLNFEISIAKAIKRL